MLLGLIISSHNQLNDLDYDNSGHTGFAGTGVANTYTQSQNFAGSAAIASGISSNTALYIRGVLNQSAPLTQWVDIFGSTFAYVDQLGRFSITPNGDNTLPIYDTSLYVKPREGAIASMGIVVQGIFGQTGPLSQWVNASGQMLALVGPTSSSAIVAGGTIIARQPVSGVAGTDEVQISHDGTDATISNRQVGDVVIDAVNLTVRQPGGTAGTDEVQISHDGTNATFRAMSGSIISRAGGWQFIRESDGALVGFMDSAGLLFSNYGFTTGPGRCIEDNTTYAVRSPNAHIQLTNASQVKWSNTADAYTGSTFVVGLARDSDGVLKVTDGSTGLGSLVSDLLIARQDGGVSGTDEVQISHDGTGGLVESKDGSLRLEGGNHSVYTTYSLGAGQDIHLTSGGTVKMKAFFSPAVLLLASDMVFGWTATSNIGGGTTPDTALARSDAGVVKVTDGSDGYGDATLKSLHVNSQPSAAGFAAASSQYLSRASNASLQTGDVDFWMAGWVKLASVASDMILFGKTTGTLEYAVEFNNSVNRFQFYVSSDGGGGAGFTRVSADTFGAPSAGQWYFVLGWYSSSDHTIRISVNGGTADAAVAQVGGAFAGTSPFAVGAASTPGQYTDGSLDSVAFGKPSGPIADVIDTLAARLYNSGSGLVYADLTAQEKTDWGLVSWYDFNNDVTIDSHGSNTLTNNNGVTLVTGRAHGTLRAYHDGTKSVIESETGALRLHAPAINVVTDATPNTTYLTLGAAYGAGVDVITVIGGSAGEPHLNLPTNLVLGDNFSGPLSWNSDDNYSLKFHFLTHLKWSNGNLPDTPDTGLARSAAGIVKVTDGSTGIGALLTASVVEANTAGSGSPNVLTAVESRKTLTNEGATAENYHTLPPAAAGLRFQFVCQDSDGIRITADTGDTIRIAGSVSASAGFVRSSAVGSVLMLEAINATEWVALSSLGTWTIDS